MNIVVTGSAGFIGSHLTEKLLSEGHCVTGIDMFHRSEWNHLKEQNISLLRQNPMFTLLHDDLLTMDLQSALQETDVVFHQAAIAGVRESWGTTFREYVDKNILALQRLLEACRTSGIKKFVYASSSSVYGGVSGKTTEDVPCTPISPYGMTKLAGEHLVRMYHLNFGLPTTALRYFTVYGPRQRPDMAFHKFLKAVLGGHPITVFGTGTQTRDFTFVSDVVEANIRAMLSTMHGNVLNIGGGQRASIQDVLKMMREATGRPVNVEYVSTQPGDPDATWSDITKARQVLGYEPKVSLRSGIEEEWRYIVKCYSS